MWFYKHSHTYIHTNKQTNHPGPWWHRTNSYRPLHRRHRLLIHSRSSSSSALALHHHGVLVAGARDALDDVLARLLAVDDGGHLLERRPGRLDEQEVHHQHLEQQPHVVHDVVLPLDRRDGNRVRVLVEDERARYEEVVEHQSLCF